MAGPSGTASGLVAGPSGTASSTPITTSTVARTRELFPNQSGEECPYDIVRVRKYEHPGAPLSGAYCVEMLRQRNRAKYDRDIQYRVCKFLRHEISKISGLTIWPDGFVNLKDLLGGIRRYSDPSDLSALFRTSYMHTQLDDGGVRFKIVYLASKKQWHLPVGSAKFQAVSASRYCTDQKSAGEIKVGFYIRVEGGMSEPTHCRVIQDLYRTRYTPDHPKW